MHRIGHTCVSVCFVVQNVLFSSWLTMPPLRSRMRRGGVRLQKLSATVIGRWVSFNSAAVKGLWWDFVLFSISCLQQTLCFDTVSWTLYTDLALPCYLVYQLEWCSVSMLWQQHRNVSSVYAELWKRRILSGYKLKLPINFIHIQI